jgi:glycosyltransferase involved in cell wall biosynthesis
VTTSAALEVTIDARWLNSGIGTYTFNLVRALKKCGELRLTAIAFSQNVDKLRPFCDAIEVLDVPIYTVREQFAVPGVASNLLHVPHYNAPLFYRDPLLVTIHDITHLLHASFRNAWKSRLYAGPMLRAASRRARHIVTVSQYSKRQIQTVLGTSDAKISVIHEGVGPQFHPINPTIAREKVAATIGVTQPYILYVGNLKPHKNLPVLFRAYASLKRSQAISQQLLIIGDDPRGRLELSALARDLSIEDAVTFSPYVTDDLLPYVYNGADLFVLPSLEEGFGLPVAEAMASGTPVVCSNAASLPEVAGDAAVMFDAQSVEDLEQAIGNVLNSRELRRDLQAKGIIQSRKFDWQQCALEHYKVYKRFCN